MFKRLVLEKGVYALLDKIVLALIGFLSIFLAARIIPQPEYGALMLSLSIYAFLILFGELGTGSALVKYGAEREDMGAVAINALFVKVLGALLFSFISVLLSSLLPDILHSPQLHTLLLIMPLLIAATIFNTFFKQLLHAKQQFKHLLCIDAAGLGTMLLLFLLLTHFHLMNSALNVLFILIATHVVSMLFGIFILRPFFHIRGELNTYWLSKITRFGSYATVGALGSMMYTRTDMLLLGYFLGAGSVAVYASAWTIANAMYIIPQAASMVFFPLVSRMSISNRTDRHQLMRSVYIKSVGTVLLITVPLSLLFLLFPEMILHLLYKEKYLTAAPVLQVLALWGIIRPWGNLAGAGVEGMGKPNVNALLIWLATVLNLSGNILLIPRMGAVGAALASVIAFSVSGPICVCYFYYLTRQRI